MWEREEEFRSLLRRAAKKATKELLDSLADIAIRDDKVAYKAVCALILHEMKQLKPGYRLKLLYVMNEILRQSKARRGERDKYAARFAPLLDNLVGLLAPLNAEQLGSVLKIVDIWWRDEIFDAPTVAQLQQQFRGLRATAASGRGGGGSSGGAPPPHVMAGVAGTAAADKVASPTAAGRKRKSRWSDE
ncbi:splicing arginine serine-rich 15 [Chlorella sorokiniana]|uniref:Splicing arginine serine-rich 15 n=1 Tax=Chlorella sorokiniana TaxID=3076 RepID=A0A2P6TCU1_CHLSO|nr:splicing arginine serine-rich 15 [Chlorella sorokiniana]|eukprot:PRW20459.1 splicing arginine serine-rich 15 [Chlorella sorokiniana]